MAGMKIKAAVVVATLTAGVLASPVSAEAAGRRACGYPYVCLYKGYQTGKPVSRFRDVTGGWQYLNRSRGAGSFKNTRHDDVAYILTTGGMVICVRPGDSGGIMPDAGGARAIRISTRSHC